MASLDQTFRALATSLLADQKALLHVRLSGTFSPGNGTAAQTRASDISVVASDDSLRRVSGSWTAEGYAVGDVVRVQGFSTAANNGWAEVTAVEALWLAVDRALTDEAAGKLVLVQRGILTEFKGRIESYALKAIDGKQVQHGDQKVLASGEAFPSEPRKGDLILLGSDLSAPVRSIEGVQATYAAEQVALWELQVRA